MMFISTHYSEHLDNPIDLLMELYDMAEYREIKQESKKVIKKVAARKE